MNAVVLIYLLSLTFCARAKKLYLSFGMCFENDLHDDYARYDDDDDDFFFDDNPTVTGYRDEYIDDGRVVGGYVTSIYDHPYQVSLRLHGRHRCGGAIIDDEWIVTAAHCVNFISEDGLSVKAGSSTLSGRGNGIQLFHVSDVVVHEDFSEVNSDYDIALVRLSGRLDFTNKVSPIVLGDDNDDDTALVVGWGVFGDDDRISDVLREVTVPLISNNRCSRLYSSKVITARMLCAGYVGQGGRDACQGDSGGPLVQHGRLIGIVSWGIGCAEPYQPGVYARIAAFRSWIADIAGV